MIFTQQTLEWLYRFLLVEVDLDMSDVVFDMEAAMVHVGMVNGILQPAMCIYCKEDAWLQFGIKYPMLLLYKRREFNLYEIALVNEYLKDETVDTLFSVLAKVKVRPMEYIGDVRNIRSSTILPTSNERYKAKFNVIGGALTEIWDSIDAGESGLA